LVLDKLKELIENPQSNEKPMEKVVNDENKNLSSNLSSRLNSFLKIFSDLLKSVPSTSFTKASAEKLVNTNPKDRTPGG